VLVQRDHVLFRTRGGSMTGASDDGDDKGAGARPRRARMLALLEDREYVSVADMAKRFGVTTMSVRRDLALLEQRGLVERVRGGAVPPRRSPRATGFFARARGAKVEEKQRIAEVAVGLLDPRAVVFFYSGTTVAAVATALPRLVRTTMTLASNSLAVIEEASGWDNPHLVSLGGLYLPEYMAFVGPQTVRALQDLSADVAVVGCDGLSAEGGLTTPHQLVAEVGATMVSRARRVIVVADATKIGRQGFTPIAPTASIDVLVTDESADALEIAALRDRGVEVLVA
jgi:DeoR/GlpR family transcriptional regulator of sugar metabolism